MVKDVMFGQLQHTAENTILVFTYWHVEACLVNNNKPFWDLLLNVLESSITQPIFQPGWLDMDPGLERERYLTFGEDFGISFPDSSG
ncbi:hypothetical protein CEXT_364161 [Caerostris extrusa]|uniref:Uncharacterized protein n=1 Tax=Caerostris extrusa TaxID=172846 RepID=A0AAV4TZU6_CAEEX|nr:hypothetical protein CEXT_364161 [Caerostris extrusa]